MSDNLTSTPLLKDSSSSSDEELKDLVVEEEEEKEVLEVKEEDKQEEEEKEEDENENENENEEEEDDDSGGFTVKKHVPSPQPQSSSSVDDDEEEADSELESDDSDVPPPPPPSENVTNSDVEPTVDKPITSIPPMDGSVKLQQKKKKKKKYSTTTTTTTDQKPQASGTVTPMKQRPSKRTTASSETNDQLEEASKKRKKVENKSSTPSKMHWSEDDEVVILKGLLGLMSKEEDTAAKPISEMIHELLENIKPLLEADHVTREQLYGKIRKLKQKYVKAKTYDSKVLKLSKKIWGTTVKDDFKGEETTEAFNGGDDFKGELEEGKKSTRSHRTKAGNAVVSPQQQLQRGDEVQSTEQSRPLPSFFNEVIESLKNSVVPPDGLKGFLAKEALGLIGSSKAEDMEEKWKKLQIAEAKIYLDRIDLVKKQVELVLHAMGTEE